MNLLSMLSGTMDYISIVQKFIDKIFVHEARKYHCKKHELKIVIDVDESDKMSIMTYSESGRRYERVIPNEEVQEILMK